MRKNLCTVLKCSLRLYCSVRSLTRELDACGEEYRVVCVCVCVCVCARVCAGECVCVCVFMYLMTTCCEEGGECVL